MSEEREKEMEVEILDHFYHPHPLTLSVVGTTYGECFGCTRYIHPLETAYVCREGCWYPRLHVECAEMPREIKLSMHPQHTLIQTHEPYRPKCAVCESGIYRIGYYCGSSDRCGFQVHVGCVQNMEVIATSIPHPSHPQHPLVLLRRPGRSCSLRCDACGTIEKGNSYLCMVCQYWIHESCAKLSATAQFQHHAHPLSLAYQLPLEYIKFNFRCDICLDALIPRYWVYHCVTCRYVVHIKCAINTTTTNVDADTVEDADVIVFPLKNGVEEMIGSFVINVGGLMANPNDQIEYKFHNHDHLLHLISSSSSSSLHHQEEEDDEEENSDDDDFNELELVCDGCTTPIFPNQQKSSLFRYLSCGECKYFLHWCCFHLPPQIPSHPLHPNPHHNLILQTCPKLDFVVCGICLTYTNGLFYGCTKCDYFKLDIKCASLPNTLKHKAHPRHHLKLLYTETTRDYVRVCNACGFGTYGDACYECDVCKILLHSFCALLPPVVTNRTWDKHRLPLTFDASVNHPSSFCCEICEEEMNPKLWMYHCRTCDLSVHPDCFPTASGMYQNVKFGQRYNVASIHHHPVAYQLLTKKLHCDVCGFRKGYGCHGFRCASDNCDFFMCLYWCAVDRKAELKAVD